MFVRAEQPHGWAYSAAFLFLAGCASVAPPQGGLRDTTPPRRISSSPDSAARNVKQQFVRLVFSEAVQTKDLSKSLLITPQLPTDNPYKLREERNAITLLFDKPLDENTTYSFNFREGIVDITESLPAKNAVLHFSTGAVLDSGVVHGIVTDVLSTAPAAEVAVGLYRETDTAGVRQGRPYYLARTDKEGKYSLGFLKAGQYKLYAVADKNNNGHYDEGEKIAYLPQPITIGAVPQDIPLILTRPDRRPPITTTQQPAATELRIGFNEGLQTIGLTALSGNAAAAAAVAEALRLTDSGRTAVLYKTAATPDGRYLLTATDSTGNVGHDTLNVRFPVPNSTVRKAAPAPLYAVEGSPRTVYRQGQVKFQFQVPVRIAAGQPFGTLVEDSVKRRPLRLPADATLSPDHTLLTLPLNTTAKTRLEIQLDSTAFTAITGQPLRLRPLRLGLTEQAATGTLIGTITTKETHFELQLLDDKLQIISRLRSPKGRFQFDNLTPGTYRLRVLIDRDGDGRWRAADPNLLLPPEPVYLHPKPLQIRANWEVEEKLGF